jgi:hypothetical protein
MDGNNNPKRPSVMDRLKLYKKPKPGQSNTSTPEEVLPPLKLYKKPKPVQPTSESPEIKEPLNFLEQIEQEEFRAKYEPPHATTPEKRSSKGLYILFAILVILLGAALFYFYYEPPPPEVQGARIRATLLNACQQGNGVACGEMALLEYLGQETLEGLPKEMPVNANNAFLYARLSCARHSGFGCYMMWRLWTKKESNLLDAETAEDTLRKGCSQGGRLPCLLKDRFAGKRDLTAAELHKAIIDAAEGKNPPRYSDNAEEQRLYTHFLATEQ